MNENEGGAILAAAIIVAILFIVNNIIWLIAMYKFVHP